MRIVRIAVATLILPSAWIVAQSVGLIQTPQVQKFPVSLPNGRNIDPEGGWIPLAPYSFAMALRPDGKQIVVSSIGYPFSLNIVDHLDASSPTVQRIPNGQESDPQVQVHMGIAYSPDGKLLYDATGDSGAVDVLSTADWRRVARISLDDGSVKTGPPTSYAGTLALSPDGKVLFVLDQGNWRIVVIDTQTRQVMTTIATGSNPFMIALSPDGHRLYITNSGLFEYQLVNGARSEDPLHTGLDFPPFGYPSKAARDGAVVEGHRVSGLGSENSPRGSSLWTYDIANPRAPRLSAKLRLGAVISTARNGVVGGSSPTGIAAAIEHVYISLAHEDAVAVVSPDGKRLEQQIPLSPFHGKAFRDKSGRPLRGVMPYGLALDSGRLYVAESGINAVGIVDLAHNQVLGHVPVGWYPAAVAVSDHRYLYVVNSKGKGSGPNAFGSATDGNPESHGVYVGNLELGSLSVIPLDATKDLAELTNRVLHTNETAIERQAMLPQIRHVFFIIRENRSFDEILGDLKGADGLPGLARYGVYGWVEEDPTLHDLSITPNAHALAQRFATSDRFFVDGDVSTDGHRWAVGMAPAPWLDVAWPAANSGRRSEDVLSAAPGRRALSGNTDGPMPEDEPEFGSIWEHVAGAQLPLLNYGEGLELEGADEQEGTEPEGQRLFLNAPVPKPVFESTDKEYATFNLGIPDQLRFAEFARDFQRRVKRGYAPALTVIRLPNDHAANPRPSDGYRFRASYVADNDLALGKIVETISHSAIWKSTAIFVTEDDAQSGVDHVDAHRSVLLVISPWVKPGYISHRHSSMVSIQKTIYELLGLGPLNLEDALAADLSDAFVNGPELQPFQHLDVDSRVFEESAAKTAHPKTTAEAKELLDCDNPRVIANEFHGQAFTAH
jgi:YVTN family beta-propeller protein